jgi:predicted dienelactone hydrolase
MIQRIGILVLVVCISSSSARGQAGPAKSYAEPGTFAVRVAETLSLTDPERAKDIATRIYYPEGAGPFPVIAFSHGLGGDKDAFGVVSRHWASHGYVVVHPTHDDRGVAMGADGMIPPADKVLDRVADVKAVLNALKQIEEKLPAVNGKLDTNRLAVAGHSYGSFITMLMGGVAADIGSDKNKSLADPRVKCVAPIAPGGRGDYGLTDESWKKFRVPAIVITGTLDTRNGRPVEWREEPYRFSPPGDKYLMVIAGANHGAYGSERAGNTAPSYVNAATTALWDYCLKGSAQGKAYLDNPDGLRAFAAGSGARISGK